MSTIQITPDQIALIHQEATQAAIDAATAYFNGVIDGKDQFPCGFSWVKIYDVKLSTRLGRALAAVGFTTSYRKGIQQWNPSGLMVQNVDTKHEGSKAYAKVFQKYGFNVVAEQLWD